MENHEPTEGNHKPAQDKLHPSDLGETKDFDQLKFNKEENSFEIDVKGHDKNYDHPLPYDTAAPDGEDMNSTYDESNPYIGDEYDTKEALQNEMEDPSMRVEDSKKYIQVDAVDKILARTPEDLRDDLDEEGYPKNDTPS